ncbi:hypothetical protein D3C75_644740 [compost metagenome]
MAVVTLVDPHRNRVKPALPHHSPGHGVIRQPDTQNFAAAKHRLLFLRHANHRCRHVPHQNNFTDHLGFVREELAFGVAIEHHHLCTPGQLLLVEGIAFTKAHAVNVKILAADTIHACRRINVAVTHT